VAGLPDRDPFAGTLSGLRVFSTRNILKNVYIKVDLDESWWDGEIVKESWLAGATTFMDPGSFPHLQEVTLDVTVINMVFTPEEVEEYRILSGEQLVQDLLKIPFQTLDLPYKFSFKVQTIEWPNQP